MKRYKIKKRVLIRLQGIILILLAYAAHKASSDTAALLFVIIGSAILMQDMHFLSRCLYKISKRIYRKFRWTEIWDK